jgi:hypothetical protein
VAIPAAAYAAGDVHPNLRSSSRPSRSAAGTPRRGLDVVERLSYHCDAALDLFA